MDVIKITINVNLTLLRHARQLKIIEAFNLYGPVFYILKNKKNTTLYTTEIFWVYGGPNSVT